MYILLKSEENFIILSFTKEHSLRFIKRVTKYAKQLLDKKFDDTSVFRILMKRFNQKGPIMLSFNGMSSKGKKVPPELVF
ncbi:MAG: hypothetical protein N2749_02040 [Clostridia bacterium]|nr:hypothetical protein [Clostridia bacterium]